MYAGSVQFDRVSNENHYRFISSHWEWYTAITDFEQVILKHCAAVSCLLYLW